VRLIRLAEGERLTGVERVEGLENGEEEDLAVTGEAPVGGESLPEAAE
jgi:hypothetical protein